MKYVVHLIPINLVDSFTGTASEDENETLLSTLKKKKKVIT